MTSARSIARAARRRRSRWRKKVVAALGLGATATIAGPFSGQAQAGTPRFGTDPFAALSTAAQETMNGRSCTLAPGRLTAMMAAVSWYEIAGRVDVSPSPLALSRYDTSSVNSKNYRLYSHNTVPDFRKAHWNPGVGLFQLDTLTPQLAQWERVYVPIAAKFVADKMADTYCSASGGTTDKTRAAMSPWIACNGKNFDRCLAAVDQIWDGSTVHGVTKDSGVGNWGGAYSKECKHPPEAPFTCYVLPARSPQGYAITSDPEGTGAPTPLSETFINFEYNGEHKSYWLPQFTGYGHEIGKRVPEGFDSRTSLTWFDETNLCVKWDGTNWDCSL